jgi:hypothetical protein
MKIVLVGRGGLIRSRLANQLDDNGLAGHCRRTIASSSTVMRSWPTATQELFYGDAMSNTQQSER